VPRNLREGVKTIGGRSVLNKRRIIKNALSFEFRDSSKAKWWLKDESLVPAAQSIAETITNITNHSLRPNAVFFKLTDRKAVFRVKLSDDSGQSLVAKAFLFPRLEHRFKYHKYGLDEVANLLKAAEKGINAPGVYGYGQIYGLFRLVEANIVITEDLHGLSPIKNLLLKGTDSERHQIFMRTIPLFVSLYNAGCNHIDVNSGAVMISEKSQNHEVFLLDFQHAKFYDKPSSEILMFEAGHFAQACRKWISTETIKEWMDELLRSIDINGTDEIQEMKRCFYYYFKAELSRKHRKKII
jgi:tRNA A-37 threonylcarbamoyl transferase component Bud32